MKNATIEKALNDCITKRWQVVVDTDKLLFDVPNCHLCEIFLEDFRCNGCPIYLYSGSPNCANTPYNEYVDAEDKFIEDNSLHSADEKTDAAIEMVEYLKRVKRFFFGKDGKNNVKALTAARKAFENTYYEISVV